MSDSTSDLFRCALPVDPASQAVIGSLRQQGLLCADHTLRRGDREIAALLQSPDIRERLAVQGLEAASNSPAEFRTYIASEVRKWAVVIKQAGVVAD